MYIKKITILEKKTKDYSNLLINLYLLFVSPYFVNLDARIVSPILLDAKLLYLEACYFCSAKKLHFTVSPLKQNKRGGRG